MKIPHFERIFERIATTTLLVIVGSACVQHSSPLLNSTPTAPPQESVIQVGEVGSMTGPEATFGVSSHQGVDLAIRQLNSLGGIKGKKIEVVILDDQSKPEEAATAATKLITENKVSVILGEVASSRSLAMAPIAQKYKIPMISPASTHPGVTATGDYIFRVCFIDPFQGQVMAKFALHQLKLKRAAILTDVKSDYSRGLSEYFRAAFQKEGGQIVVEESYGSGDRDFKSQLTAIRAKNPEAIFIPGYYAEVGLIARQARELGISAILLGGDGWDSQKLAEIGGKAIQNSYFSNHYSNESQSPQTQDFITQFKTTYGVLPDGLSAMGYDAVMVLADAMKRAKSFQPADIRDALASTQNFSGVTGNITIDSQRNAVKSAVVLKVLENGYFKYQTTIHP